MLLNCQASKIHYLEQFGKGKGFAEQCDFAYFMRLGKVFFCNSSTHQHKFWPQHRLTLQPIVEFKTGHVWHVVIDKQQVKLACISSGKKLLCIWK